MHEQFLHSFPVAVTRKWLALAERRKSHLIELYETGRWQLYYSEEEFVYRMREAIYMVERWSATEQSSCESQERNGVNGLVHSLDE